MESYASNSQIDDEFDSDEFSAIDENEILGMEAVFSQMIDKTCVEGPAAKGNIFSHSFHPHDGYGAFFRSIVPSQDALQQQQVDEDLPRQLFCYTDHDGVHYAFKVLDRRTNRLVYEQMPSYHRYGMKLVFKGPVQREMLHTRAIKKFFEHETKKLGRAFDDPESRKHISSFVKMYQINLNELLFPDLSHYKNFNEFFYRKLQPNARPIADPDDPKTIVSAADCRLIIFNNIDDATRLWIKGRHFSLKTLFDNKDLAEEFDGGSVAVFRLAPVDYHRFHSPVAGRIDEKIRTIDGTYYTVNPIAVRRKIDVLTKNQRKVMIIKNDVFEQVAFVAIGALLVGSVNFTVEPNRIVEKGDELGEKSNVFFAFFHRLKFRSGYFAYGGSTVVIVFKAGMVKWDDDLLHNSNNSMETLVRVGERIGQRTSDDERAEHLSFAAKISKKNSTISQLFGHFPTMDLTKQ